MSMSLILVPIAVAVFVTSADAVDSIKDKKAISGAGKIEGIQTKYVNADLLMKTLVEHGSRAKKVSDLCLIADFLEGRITYNRSVDTEPFSMDITNVSNVDSVICNIEMIETEYNANVQTYLYNRVMNNLPENMSMESEEILEDDSILITLSVD